MNTAVRQRIATVTLAAIGIAIAYAIVSILGMAIAHADAGDPTAASAAAGAGWDVVIHQGPLFGGLLLAYGIFRRFLAANESAHWIAQGKTLSILTAVAMVGGAAIDWHFDGAPAAGIMTALFAAVSLVMHSTVTSASKSST